MSMRDKEVLNMQLVLIPVLAEAWKKTYSELSDLLKKYDVLSYIDVCYENYNDFEEIDLSAGKGYKDFGKGFYATAVPSHAERLAIRNKSIAEKRQSFLKNKKGIKIQPIVAYRYDLLFSEETAGLKVKVLEKADKEWLRFILQNLYPSKP